MGIKDFFRVSEIKESNAKLQKDYVALAESMAMVTASYSEVKESLAEERSTRGYGYESLAEITGINTDFDQEKHFKMQERARESYLFSPMSKRIVDYTTSYVTGKDFKIKSENEMLQGLIDSIVKDPKNKFNRQKREWMKRIMIDGEVFVTVHLGENGSCILRETDPFEIKEVMVNPEDRQEAILYKREWSKSSLTDGEEIDPGETQVEYILDISAELKDTAQLKLTAEQTAKISISKRIQQIKTITFSNRKRGVSQLMSVLYYLTRIRKDIDKKSQLNELLGAFFLDVKVKGGPQDVTTEQNKQQYKRPPKAGSTLVHNESVEYKLLSPQINHNDNNESLKPVMQQTIIGSGMPEWMLTGQSNMYKAGAQEQSAPFAKLIEDLQEMTGDEYIKLFTFLINWKLSKHTDRDNFKKTSGEKGKLAEIDKDGMIEKQKLGEDGETMTGTGEKVPFWEFLEVQFPDIIVRDQEKESKALQNDMANKLVSKQTASTQRGYDYDSEKILIQKEFEEEEARNPMNLDDITNHDPEEKPEPKKKK